MTEYLTHYGYAFLFVVVLLESTGLPLPGESLVMAAGMLAGEGSLSLTAVFLTAMVGAVVGDNLGYLLGRRYGRGMVVRWGEKVGLGERRFAMVEKRFEDYGLWVVLVARFIIILRQLNGFVAGTMHMSWPKFLVLNTISAALWAGAYGLGAYIFGAAFRVFFAEHGTWPIIVIAAGICLVGCVGTYRFLFRAEAEEEPETVDDTTSGVAGGKSTRGATTGSIEEDSRKRG